MILSVTQKDLELFIIAFNLAIKSTNDDNLKDIMRHKRCKLQSKLGRDRRRWGKDVSN